MSDKEAVGRRFSEVYLAPKELHKDSPRMRRRIGAAVYRFAGNIREELNAEVGTNLGSPGSRTTDYWPSNFKELDLRDVLDAITVASREIKLSDGNLAGFLYEVERIFDEEHVCYRVDPEGGVHFRVDVEFELSRVAAISALSKQRYNAVRVQFESAHAALDTTPLDGKTAIRCSFFALEGLFRLIFPKAHQLSGGEINKHLKPRTDQFFADERPALYVAQKQLEALKDWVDAAHFYRHEPGTEEPNQPPLALAVMMVSQASSYLRWLTVLDET